MKNWQLLLPLSRRKPGPMARQPRTSQTMRHLTDGHELVPRNDGPRLSPGRTDGSVAEGFCSASKRIPPNRRATVTGISESMTFWSRPRLTVSAASKYAPCNRVQSARRVCLDEQSPGGDADAGARRIGCGLDSCCNNRHAMRCLAYPSGVRRRSAPQCIFMYRSDYPNKKWEWQLWNYQLWTISRSATGIFCLR